MSENFNPLRPPFANVPFSIITPPATSSANSDEPTDTPLSLSQVMLGFEERIAATKRSSQARYSALLNKSDSVHDLITRNPVAVSQLEAQYNAIDKEINAAMVEIAGGGKANGKIGTIADLQALAQQADFVHSQIRAQRLKQSSRGVRQVQAAGRHLAHSKPNGLFDAKFATPVDRKLRSAKV